MGEKITKRLLPFDETIAYFYPHIRCGKRLAEAVCEEIDFTKGSFFTLLPSHIPSASLLNFEIGIIPSTPYGDKVYKADGSGETVQSRQVITTDYPCSELVFQFLRKNSSHLAIVESTLLTREDRYAEIENVEMLSFDLELYYILSGKYKTFEICDTIRKAGEVWHFLMFLTSAEDRNRLHEEAYFKRICKNARFVIAGAYDGEGYIFWEASEATEKVGHLAVER